MRAYPQIVRGLPAPSPRGCPGSLRHQVLAMGSYCRSQTSTAIRVPLTSRSVTVRTAPSCEADPVA